MLDEKPAEPSNGLAEMTCRLKDERVFLLMKN